MSARSISEEFSSGDTRYRDEEATVSQGGAHARDPKSGKDKEDKERDEGKKNIMSKRFYSLISVILCFCAITYYNVTLRQVFAIFS